MHSYIEENRDWLSSRYYIRFGEDPLRLDLHKNPLNEYRTEYLDNFCLIFYFSKVQNDVYIVPVSELDDIFTEDNLWPEVGENFEIGRQRWKFKIEDDILTVLRKRGSNKKSTRLDISGSHNNFELLGPGAHAWAPFPPQEERVSVLTRNNVLFI